MKKEIRNCGVTVFSSTDAEGVVDVLVRSACDQLGRRRYATLKVEKTTLVANVKQHAVIRAMQDEEYQELQEAIEHMNERHKKGHAHDGTRTEVDGRDRCCWE